MKTSLKTGIVLACSFLALSRMAQSQAPAGQHGQPSHQQLLMVDQAFGTGDLGDRLNAALHSRPRRNLLIKVPPGVYRLDHTVWLGETDNVTVDLEGVDAAIADGVTGFSIGGHGARGLELRGGRFHGGKSCFQSFNGDDQVSDGLRLELESCTGTSGPGIYLYNNGAHWNNFRHVAIEGGEFRDTGAENILVSGVDTLRLVHTRLRNPGLVGPNHGSQPVNVDIGSAKHVLVEDNDVSGTPLWNNTPFEQNSPGSGIYVVESQDVRVLHNTVHDSKCTAAACKVSGPYGSLPDREYGREVYGADGIHLDSVQDGEIRNNQVSDYVRGIVNEVGMNVVVADNRVLRSWNVGMQDSSRFEETMVDGLQTTDQLSAGAGVEVSADAALKMEGNSSVQVQVPEGFHGKLLGQVLAINRKLGPIADVWIGSAHAIPAGTLELWISSTVRVEDAENRLALPVLSGGQWQHVRMPASTMMLLDSKDGGMRSWALVAVKPMRTERLHVERLSFVLDAFNNTYTGNLIRSTGMQAFSSTGCGEHTIIEGNTIENPGAMGDSTSVAYGAAISLEPRGKRCVKSEVTIANNSFASQKGTLLRPENYVPIGLSGPYADGGLLKGVTIQGNVAQDGPDSNRPVAIYRNQGGAVQDVHAVSNGMRN